MANPVGTWQINANGFRGDLVISSVDPQGNLTGTIFGDPVVGFWNETAQKIIFARSTGGGGFAALQIYTGFHFDANQPLFPAGGTVQPPAPPFQFRMLVGSFEALSGGSGGAASRSTFGWMARQNA
jgi:hypothetical protein